MTPAPLFIADVATLQRRLRLSGVDSNDDQFAVFEDAMRAVRAGFYRELTHSRISTLKSYAQTDDPTTNAEYLRLLADVTEVLWTKAELMKRLPVKFKAASADDRHEWNDNPDFRESDERDRARELSRLLAEVQENLDLLSGQEQAGNESQVHTTIIGPESKTPLGGAALPVRFE